MAVYPTRWPIFEFSFTVWKFHMATAIMSESLQSDTYEYIRLGIYWKNKELYHFRLYDTYRRRQDRLKELTSKGIDYTVEQLEEIRDIANEQIEIIKK